MEKIQIFLNTMGECFNGAERIEFLEPIGKPMRKGSPDELKVSDKDRASAAIGSRDVRGAGAYLDLIQSGHIDMYYYLYEWALQFTDTLNRHRPAEAQGCALLALHKWKDSVAFLKTVPEQDQAVGILSGLLEAQSAIPGASDEFRAARSLGADGSLSGVTARIGGIIDGIRKALNEGRFTEACAMFDSYWLFSCVIHDGLVQYVQSFCESVAETFDQGFVEKMVSESFSSCSFFERFWMLPLVLNTEQCAAFIAEHLRFHFSGAGRGGFVEVEEGEDCYKLIFGPCGSAGAMRQRQAASAGGCVLRKASQATWNRANEVPAYCTHCALNEAQSIKRFGYPVFVTDFDPDPARPCVWKVYENPYLIPEKYFTRLGFAKDPSKFGKLMPEVAVEAAS